MEAIYSSVGQPETQYTAFFWEQHDPWNFIFIARIDTPHDNKENHTSITQSKVYLRFHQMSTWKHIYFNLGFPSHSLPPTPSQYQGDKNAKFCCR